MRYINSVDFNVIKSNYKKIIAWGLGPIFEKMYKPYYFHINAIIDGRKERVGEKYKNIEICAPEILKNESEKTLVVIYTIYENEVVEEIKAFENENIDIILCALLRTCGNENMPYIYINAKNAEDMILLDLVNQLNLDSMRYLEVGVCHPILRNNSYLLSERYHNFSNYKGVLVEANPLCWGLIEEYRPYDILVKAGIMENESSTKFYSFPDLLGHSTFVEKIAKNLISDGYKCKEFEIKTLNINTILEEYFDRRLDILAIDAEGMDEKILESINFDQTEIRIVLCERSFDDDDTIGKMMKKCGYYLHATTIENAIWVKKEEE